jgi:protein gp37
VSDNTHIEWTDATWNPITGCSVVSAGCKHCYAIKLAQRLSALRSWNDDSPFGSLERLATQMEQSAKIVRDALADPAIHALAQSVDR